jgi:hypothetical protein
MIFCLEENYKEMILQDANGGFDHLVKLSTHVLEQGEPVSLANGPIPCQSVAWMQIPLSKG